MVLLVEVRVLSQQQIDKIQAFHDKRLGSEIGRHEGLKIPWTEMSVRVRFPPEAQKRGTSSKGLYVG